MFKSVRLTGEGMTMSNANTSAGMRMSGVTDYALDDARS